MTITPAKIQFNPQGTPVAADFDDVYFSNDNGMEETRYVFLHNNQIPERWTSWLRDTFVVAETGFGTGLNFLTCVEAFLGFRAANPDAPLRRLHFISTEKYPLEREDLRRALSCWPALSGFSTTLIDHFPAPVSGCHRLSLAAGRVTLDLWLGDVLDSFPAMQTGSQGLVDAWFLDGFAPSKNPDMWSQALFDQMARLSRPQATFATFTAAGFVKRGLQDAGFNVQKRKGYGKKRDMLAGEFPAPVSSDQPPSAANTLASERQPVIIIGAGLAGANLAYSLAQRGIDVTLYGKSGAPADGASGNPIGGFYPQLHVDVSHASQIQACSFLFARQRYQQLMADGFDFAHDWCGVLLVGYNDQLQQRQNKMVNAGHWPKQLLTPVTAADATQLCGVDMPYPGLFVPQGGWVSPPQLVEALLRASANHASVNFIADQQLERLYADDNGWQLHWQSGDVTQAATVVLASGADSRLLPALADVPLRFTRGQVESIASQPALDPLSCVVCHKGYLTPALEGHHALGSTYVRLDSNCDYRIEEQDKNLNTLTQALPACDWAQQVRGQGNGRAALRCNLPDHQPLVGQVAGADGLFTLTGLGSRGLTTAPLMAELLASQLCGEPSPLPDYLINAVSSTRFKAN